MAVENKVLRGNIEDLHDENRAIKFILDKKQNGGTKNEHTKNQSTVTTYRKVSKPKNNKVLIFCFTNPI